MNFFEKFQALDRRIIYVLVFFAVALPLAIPYNAKTYTTEHVENIYQLIDSYSGRSDRAVLLSFFHNASTMPELFPMEVAILRHCFERNVKVITLCFLPTAAPLIDYAITNAKTGFASIESGVDYCNVGYIPGALYLQTILGMGEDISNQIDTDSVGRKLSSLPIMQDIKNYNEMNLIIEFSGSSYGISWVTYARSKFGVNVACGVTAVMAADAYPFIQTGQLVGMLAGLKGASEYEKLVDTFASYEDESSPNGRIFSKEVIENTLEENTYTISDQKNYKYKTARIGMNAQSVAHILIVVFILIGNIGYFLQRGKEK